jgi:hypothetical protein
MITGVGCGGPASCAGVLGMLELVLVVLALLEPPLEPLLEPVPVAVPDGAAVPPPTVLACAVGSATASAASANASAVVMARDRLGLLIAVMPSSAPSSTTLRLPLWLGRRKHLMSALLNIGRPSAS